MEEASRKHKIKFFKDNRVLLAVCLQRFKGEVDDQGISTSEEPAQ